MNASFAYDAMGRRVERTVNGDTTKYLYEGMQAIGEIRGNSETRLLTGLAIDEMTARYTDQSPRTYLNNRGQTFAVTAVELTG